MTSPRRSSGQNSCCCLPFSSQRHAKSTRFAPPLAEILPNWAVLTRFSLILTLQQVLPVWDHRVRASPAISPPANLPTSTCRYFRFHLDFFSALHRERISCQAHGSPDVPSQRPADTKGGGEAELCSSRSPRTACGLCFKPVHLIQRRLAEGKVYHRSCFR